MQNNALTSNIYDGTNKVVEAVNDTHRQLNSEISGVNSNVFESSRQLNSEISGVNKNIFDSTNAMGINSERAAAGINKSIFDATTAINFNTERGATSINKNIFDNATAHGLAIERTAAITQNTVERANSQLGTAVERNGSQIGIAVERNGGNILGAIERVAGEGRLTTTITDAASREAAAMSARDIVLSVERNGANGMSATERINSQLGTAIERNGGQIGSAVERNGGTILGAIERVAGEGRLTTTIADAASREAAAMSARDVLSAVERNGANSQFATKDAMNLLSTAVDRTGAASVTATKDTFAGLLGSIERNAGENRMTMATQSALTNQLLTDVRHSIINDTNRGLNDIVSSNSQHVNALQKSILDNAWEARVTNTNSYNDISKQSAHHYASLLLEDQKNKEHIARQSSQQYASLLLEDQKNKEHVSSKLDNNYASLLLEQQKVKEGLAMQASNHFAISQLESQKIKECLSAQLADAKYEALKHRTELSKEMSECCCEIKQKIDQRTQDVLGTVEGLDRDRLRDAATTTANENSLLKIVELADGFGGGYGYDRGGRGSRHRPHGRH
jgi:hypothetical protein